MLTAKHLGRSMEIVYSYFTNLFRGVDMAAELDEAESHKTDGLQGSLGHLERRLVHSGGRMVSTAT